jgi:type IV pilus assembly protein PilZ
MSEEDPPNRQQGMLSLSIRDAAILYAYFMPFIKNGGLFIPTQRAHRLGDEVFVLLHLMDEPERIPVVGKVVLMTPKQSENQRPQGIGIQFDDNEGPALKARIESYLADFKGSQQPTHTF